MHHIFCQGDLVKQLEYGIICMPGDRNQRSLVPTPHRPPEMLPKK